METGTTKNTSAFITSAAPGDPLQITDTLSALRSRGYSLSFRKETTCLHCVELDTRLMPHEFEVDEYHHFEDSSRPDSGRTVYAISAVRGLKGFLVDTCLVYEDNTSREMMHKLEWSYV